MFEFSALLYVYRHANLCSGLRTILSPQFIKKLFQFLSIVPAVVGSEPAALTEPWASESDALPTTPWASDGEYYFCG